jgi:hypothetical protein
MKLIALYYIKNGYVRQNIDFIFNYLMLAFR